MLDTRRFARWAVWLVLLVLLEGCQTDLLTDLSVLRKAGEASDTTETLNLAEEYFLEVGLGSEFGAGEPTTRKWLTDLKIFVPDREHPHLNEELDRIIGELNDLSESIALYEVSRVEEANFIVYFGDKDTYVQKYEPNAKNFVDGNLGLFWVYWTRAGQIVKGSLYVDVRRVSDHTCQKHLLREELTQALGLMNDSFTYENSIFYQKWSCVTDYAPIDGAIIQYLLNPEITPGMTKDAVREVLLRIQ